MRSLAAAVGIIFGDQTPNMRPFSLADRDISFPFVTKEKVSTPVLFLSALIGPAAVIFVVALLFVPGPTVPKSVPTSLRWKRKAWEWYTGWTGLALSCASSYLITGGMKVGNNLPSSITVINLHRTFLDTIDQIFCLDASLILPMLPNIS
jgi:hypothetical protein